MFDHLDDDLSFRPDSDFRTGTLRRGRRLRRRRQAATGAAICGSTALLALGGLGWYTRDQLEDIDRVEIGETLAPPPASPTEPINVLLVGTDENLAAELGIFRNNADAVVVVRADPVTGRLSVLSVPRDLLISEAGGEAVKLNAVLAAGGSDQLVATVQGVLGIPIHHYVQVAGSGFVELFDRVGGVDLEFEVAMRDSTTGFFVDGPGCRTLDGAQALAFARSRRTEVLSNEGWDTDPSGDLGRIARQRVLASAAVSAVVDLQPTPDGLSTLVGVLADHAQIDDEFSSDELLAWGRWLISRGEANVTTYSLPVELGNAGAASVLRPGVGWDKVVDNFMQGVPPTPAPTNEGTPIPLITPC